MNNQTQTYPQSTILRHTPASAVASSAVVLLAGLVGIAINDIAAGAEGSVETRGTYRLTKASGAGTDIAIGAPLWWDATNSRVSETPTSYYLGICAMAAATTDTQVWVDINEHRQVNLKHTVTAAEDTANEAVLETGLGADPTTCLVHIYSVADPSVPRLPASVDYNGDGTVTVAHASLAENETIHVHASL